MIATLDSETSPVVVATTDYWSQSRRPLASLLFVLPLLLVYEGGLLWLGPEAIRNGADVWLQQLLGILGFGGFLLLPLVTIGILLAWHHTTGHTWRVSGSIFYTMAIESALFAMVLVAVAHLHTSVLSITGSTVACEISGETTIHHYLGHLVRYSGAGIYEELLFRLVLVPAMIAGIGLVVTSWKLKIIGALLVTSLVFSAAHYIGPHGDVLHLGTFIFRFLAGAFFALLFVFRGFGIAAVTHAFYDILVGFPSS